MDGKMNLPGCHPKQPNNCNYNCKSKCNHIFLLAQFECSHRSFSTRSTRCNYCLFESKLSHHFCHNSARFFRKIHVSVFSFLLTFLFSNIYISFQEQITYVSVSSLTFHQYPDYINVSLQCAGKHVSEKSIICV